MKTKTITLSVVKDKRYIHEAIRNGALEQNKKASSLAMINKLHVRQAKARQTRTSYDWQQSKRSYRKALLVAQSCNCTAIPGNPY